MGTSGLIMGSDLGTNGLIIDSEFCNLFPVFLLNLDEALLCVVWQEKVAEAHHQANQSWNLKNI